MFKASRMGPVLLVSPEGGIRGLARRIEAILRPIGGTPRDLDIAFVRTRSLSLTDGRDVGDLRAACAAERPVLIAYDSIYVGLEGVGTSRLSEFGAALGTLSDAAAEYDAAVVTTHHLNAKEGAGLHRLTGAGPAEWASAVLLGTPGARIVAGGTTGATVQWALTARDVPDLAFSTTFSIGSEDPSDLSSPIDYRVTVAFDEGSLGTELGWVERRVLDTLSMFGAGGCSIREINDVLAREGKPFKHETIRDALARLVDLDLVDGAEGRWWTGAPSQGKLS
jgi:hypothetical protein